MLVPYMYTVHVMENILSRKTTLYMYCMGVIFKYNIYIYFLYIQYIFFLNFDMIVCKKQKTQAHQLYLPIVVSTNSVCPFTSNIFPAPRANIRLSSKEPRW